MRNQRGDNMSDTEKLKRELHVAVQVDTPSYLVDLCHRALKRIDQLEADNLRLRDEMESGSWFKESDIDALQAENERLRKIEEAAKLACPHGERLLHGANVSISAAAYKALCAATAKAEGN